MWRDSETEIDYLNFKYSVNLLKELINNDKLLPATIGVYGDWGSGKSSLIKMAIESFEQDKESEENIVTINFNSWIFEGYEDAKSVLLETILDTIQENSTLKDKGERILKGLYKSIDKIKLAKKGLTYGIDAVTTGGVGILVDQVVKGLRNVSSEEVAEDQITKTIQSIKDELNLSEIRNDIKNFQDNFSELLKESQIDKLVVFIDELDRCSPDTIIDTLEAMRLFVFAGDTVFIIGADERHISYSVERKYSDIEGNQISIGKEYLEKLVQYPVRIPKMNSVDTEFYIFCLLLDDEFEQELADSVQYKINEIKHEDFLNFNLSQAIKVFSSESYFGKINKVFLISQQLANVLSTGLNGNPRQCKRFLNSMKMREVMASVYNTNLDRMTLTKIMLLEYFKPAAYETLTILSSKNTDGKVQEINEIEDDLEAASSGNQLGPFFEDDWGKNWLKLDPPLSDIDLKSYLFFTRDSLRTPIHLTSLELSKDGREVLNLITSKARTGLTQALERAKELSRFDKVEITKILSNNLENSKNDKGLFEGDSFRNLFEWISTNTEILNDSLIYIQAISGKEISRAASPFIVHYINREEDSNKEIEEIIKQWRKENEALNEAIEKSEVK